MTKEEIRAESIESLRLSLPELSNGAFEKVNRQFFLKANAKLLGFTESSGENWDWDEILDYFDAESGRRRKKELADQPVPGPTREEWEAFCNRFGESTGRPLPPNRRPKTPP